MNKLIFFFIVLFTTQVLYSQETNLTDKFGFYSHTFDTTTIPYRLFIPNVDKGKTQPLIITLHGAGERGNNNKKHIELHGLATVWVDSANQKKHPCFVVAPQCPEENRWVDVDWRFDKYDFSKTPISNELATVSDLIDSLIAKYPIDKKRIYITGLSMGGFGSWYLLMKYPDRFAAAIIMSGAADPQMACKIKEIPVWDFHGDKDKAVPVEGSRNMIKAISDCGKDILLISNPNNKIFLEGDAEIKRILSSKHLYTEYAGKGHVIWKESYNNFLVREWLFSKTKE